uniref:RNA-dependent RNA polymerase n=1 Tax=Erigeron breviscapus mitovirus 1 TaxID=2080460 RepID=A0A2Z6JJ40_9VIRU|nr:TPA_inf: RNA-dependent RNA polymerase [Erigeron breviscapus mitovirus 1]DAB41752.1 TPA_inf: RNA-dependent RNA polymerase [Erigeron breviscapus mitovirus 1]
MNLFKLNKILQARVPREWRRLLEQPRRLIGLFNKAQLVVFGRLTKGNCLAILSLSRFICRLYKKNGPLFVAKYLKQALVLVMWYVGSKGVAPRPSLSMHMKLTKSGLPCMLPSLVRKRIRRREGLVIKLVVTVLSFYRLMKVGKAGWRRVNHTTIHHPKFQMSDSTQKWCVALLQSASSMLAGYAPRSLELPISLGFSWDPIFKSGPNTYKSPSEASADPSWKRIWESYAKKRSSKKGKVAKYHLTQYHTLPVDASALLTLWTPEFLANMASILYHPREHSPIDGYDNPVRPMKEGVDGFNWLMGDLLIPAAQSLWWDTMVSRPENGRFGLSLEGAGKVRTFAIPNSIVQRLVKPLHDWEMSVLKMLVTDGTYNQTAPLLRLKGKKELYSFDLKAATDMLPANLSGSMLSGLFGDDFGLLWYHLMNMTAFRSPEKTGSPLRARLYRFTRGQPLGFYSSWPSFALTHHMLVWLAAWRVYPSRIFKDYALLGDDIVIADKKVAEVYMKVMEEAGGIINLEKSLISHNGCCEFAKKFFIDYHRSDWVDASPISSACLILSHTSLAGSLFQSLGCGFTASFRLKGAGYRVLARVDRSKPEKVFGRLSRRWKRHWLSLHTTSSIRPLPLLVWLSFPDLPGLTCYQVGMVRWFLLKAAKPRDLDEESVSMLRCFWKGHEETLERFLVSFMQSHLRYLKWYCEILLDYERPLEDLLKPPISSCKIDRAKDDSFVVQRFGLIFKCWDLLRSVEAPLPLGSSGINLMVERPFRRICLFRTSTADQNISL